MGKTAVIVIHGIGEQRPMGTVSGFTRFFAGDFFRSKPDPKSPFYELRRLSTYVDDPSRPSEQALVKAARTALPGYPAGTVFYEFYWAFHYRDTRTALVTSWVLTTLARFLGTGDLLHRGRKVITVITACLFTAAVFLIAVGLVAWGFAQLLRSGGSVWSGAWSIATGILMPHIAAVLQPFFVGWVGDAARYLGASPDNPVERQEIRKAGIDLLRRIHEQKDASGNLEYDSIVFVGHSLGSVIAYDILMTFWLEVNRQIKVANEDAALAAVETLTGLDAPTSPDQWPAPDAKRAKAYRAAQTNLVDVIRRNAEPTSLDRPLKDVWRVRDFVTLGSPLTYARLLLAANGKELYNREQQRELPTCPPTKDSCPDQTGRQSFVFTYTPITGAGYAVPDQTAPFLLTRWTNLYFPQDPIGGPLQPVFGWGIRDEVVKIRFRGYRERRVRLWMQWITDHFFGGAHVRYWETADEAALQPVSPDCAKLLRRIVHGP